MENNWKEIYTSGLLKCPAKLENLSLTDWAAWHDYGGKPYVKETYEVEIDGLPLETFLDGNQNDD